MSGRRLLDIALLYNAAKHVAKQHVKLRSEQFEVYNKTSSLARTVKLQTDQITLSAKSAAARASSITDQTRVAQYSAKETPAKDVPRPSSTDDFSSSDLTSRKKALHEDHHYERSTSNTSQGPASKSELGVQQEISDQPPTTDGSKPQRDSAVSARLRQAQRDSEGQIPSLVTERPDHTAQASSGGEDHFSIRFRGANQPLSSLPRQKIPNTAHTADHQQTQSVQDGLNSDVFYSPTGSELSTGGTNEAPEIAPEEANTNVFRSPRVAKSLSAQARVAARQTANDAAVNRAQHEKDIRELASDIASETSQPMNAKNEAERGIDTSRNPEDKPMRESRVPSSRFGRLWEYGGLATSMAFGAVGETFRRATGQGSGSGSLMLSAANMERLVAKLSHMRGAALKLGQMMSFQDSKMLPGPIHEVLLRVQDHADYMPASQRNKVLDDNLGSDWRSLFTSFDDVPIAAASIGQVHRAVMASDGTEVAVKIQYPGVANSISSDLSNLSVLLTASRLLPKGLFLDKTIANARTELAWECDYIREAQCQKHFKELLHDETEIFTVPTVYDSACGKQVLTAELMHGTAVTKPSLNLSQERRDWIGTNILRLCLRELVEFRYMQTDPNWTNFLFNPSTQKIELLDFGATRDYPDKFIDPYVGILIAASTGDKATIQDLSIQLGYLTGHESRAMVDAHIASILTLAEPFHETLSKSEYYDFRDQTITDRVRGLIPVMLRERLAPPPEETYSLHRKLSGAFLLLARLGSRVKCRQLFEEAISTWKSRKSSSHVE